MTGKMSVWVAAGLSAAALCVAGCDKQKSDGAKGADKEKSAQVEKRARGLEAKGNDPAVIAGVKKALTCEWKSYGFSSRCDAMSEYRKSDALKRGRADATMVNLLEDDDAKVRWLAATTLKRQGKVYEGDAKLGARVVAAAEAEKDGLVARAIARAIAEIDLSGTKLVDKVASLAQNHPVESFRAALVRSVLFRNRSATKLYKLVSQMARSEKSDDVRGSAVDAFWIGTPSGKHGEVCELWADVAAKDKVDRIADAAMRLAAQSPNARCKDKFDGLMQLAEKKAKAGTVKSSDVAHAMKYIHNHRDTPEAQKKQALGIAKTLLANSANKGMARSAALRFVGEADPKGAKLAAKYLTDKDFFVKNAAKRIANKKMAARGKRRRR